jgi:hypothetical protein
MRLYRTRKRFAVVHLERTGEGRIVFLPEGAELCAIGLSACLQEGFEVVYEMQRYSIFRADLLGPWSDPIRPSEIPAAGASAAESLS